MKFFINNVTNTGETIIIFVDISGLTSEMLDILASVTEASAIGLVLYVTQCVGPVHCDARKLYAQVCQ